MAQLYRLLVRAQMDGAVREPGYLFTLPLDPDGKEILGPHRTVEHGSDYNDLNPDSPNYGKRIMGTVKDVPLYEPVNDIDPDADGEATAEPQGETGEPYSYASHRDAMDRMNNLHALGDNVTHVQRREREALTAKFGRPNPDVPRVGAMAGGTEKMADEDAARQAHEQQENEAREQREREAAEAEAEASRAREAEEAEAKRKRDEDAAYAQLEADEARERQEREAANKNVDLHGTD